jgi:predicted naringenin-chalcone synthase
MVAVPALGGDPVARGGEGRRRVVIESSRTLGIEALFVDVPRQFLDVGALARANGVDPQKYYFGLGGRRMAVPGADEDPVVLAVNAARGALSTAGVEPGRVGLVVVGTESAVDGAKPIAAWVHRAAGLSNDCRVFDLQHACIGGAAQRGEQRRGHDDVADGARANDQNASGGCCTRDQGRSRL